MYAERSSKSVKVFAPRIMNWNESRTVNGPFHEGAQMQQEHAKK